MPDADFGWSLDDSTNINTSARTSVASRSKVEETCRTCPECSHLWLASEDGPACTCCGWMPAPKPKTIAFTDADLREINGAPDTEDAVAVEKFYREALGWYAIRWPDRWAQREKSARWAAWMWTRERFELTAERPPGNFWRIAPAPAGLVASGWLKSRLIAYRRRREQAACA
jgi:hypothetical protein